MYNKVMHNNKPLKNSNWDVIIIGAGVSGLAVASEIQGLKVLIIEKTSHCGNKLLLSGSGQCNITHTGSINEFEDKYGDKWRFVRNILNNFTNEDLINKFERANIEMISLKNKKVFPKSMRANDVLQALLKMVDKQNTKINTDETVIDLNIKNEIIFVKTNKEEYRTKRIIIATGGISYKKTGSTGDAYRFADMLGIEVVQPRYALSPIYIKQHKLSSLTGISFIEANMTHWRDNKKINTYSGDLLITHLGFSGPVVINNSRNMRRGDILKINFSSYKSVEGFEKNFIALLSLQTKKTVKKICSEFLIKRFVDLMFEIIEIKSNIRPSELKKEHRKKLIDFIVNYEIKIDSVGNENIAMVTAGGISIKELNKNNLSLKKHPQVYFIGECIDVDGDTGGYNIQFAFSSAYATARSIMNELKNKKTSQ